MELIDFEREINAMNSAYTAKLNLRVRKIDVGFQKIDYSSLKTYYMVITVFHVFDELSRL